MWCECSSICFFSAAFSSRSKCNVCDVKLKRNPVGFLVFVITLVSSSFVFTGVLPFFLRNAYLDDYSKQAEVALNVVLFVILLRWSKIKLIKSKGE